MQRKNEKVFSVNGKRQILIADDEMINRAQLEEMLKDEYELLFACDGPETLAMMREHRSTLSLVLLDVVMPGMSGLEVLKTVRSEEGLARIPIIVTTSERETEIESLVLGAIDFIPKPYPDVGVIHARIRRTIELTEDRDTIQSTERDPLTGLYNREYFYRYARQFDQYHEDLEMDAVILDINHFHMINERYGKPYGDSVLIKLAGYIQEAVHENGGIVCRTGADTFMVYCPHREDYEQLTVKGMFEPSDEAGTENRVRLRIGVYPNADKSIDMEQRFDRAKMAADTVRETFTKTVGYYNKQLHEKQLYAEQLIEGFPAAIAENQFRVFYQPKFDIRPDTPVLASAEALVRWMHPQLGMISPGVFIPLFEENGLICQLDHYVWRETAKQIRAWKDELHYSIPVSVNVSRIDMFDTSLPSTLKAILEEYQLTGQDFLLEVTESAYTQDSRQIIQMVETLRGLGFRIEMDDFGTGYSSLHMISALPIDALKLDMQFIRSAFAEGGNTHMLGVIIGIADYLSVPVIAEGVETEEQLRTLKFLGCDLVQGYFFSKPVPAPEFEAFILQKKETEHAEEEKRRAKNASGNEEGNTDDIVRQARLELLRSQTDQEQEEKVKAEQPDVKEYEELPREHSGIHLKTATAFFAVMAFIAAVALLAADLSVSRGYQRMKTASDRYIEAQMAASDMESGSDYLTDRVRCFVVTGEVQYLKDFVEEVKVTRRRDGAVENLGELLGDEDSSALNSLNTALSLSNELVAVEDMAMRLMVEAGDYNEEDIPENIASIVLEPEDQELTAEELKDKAQSMVFDNNYMHYKDRIRENVRLCTQALIHSSSQELENSSAKLSLLVNIQTAMTIVFLLIVLGIVIMITEMIRKPLTNMVLRMQDREPILPTGVEELRFVTRTYNRILRENRESQDKLSHEASHDALTGLFNRGAYDLWMESADTKHIALILIDVDYFKSVNDTYGHAVGDRVLKRVADILRGSFRSVDILCRIGGDEFAVVMTRVNSSMRQLVYNKISRANDLLQHPKDDLPPVSLSVGVAFSDRDNPEGDIFKDADTALYRVKQAGRKGCEIF